MNDTPPETGVRPLPAGGVIRCNPCSGSEAVAMTAIVTGKPKPGV